MSEPTALEKLLRPQGLQSRLDSILPRATPCATRVGLYVAGEMHFAATGLSAAEPEDAGQKAFYPGCAVKLFIATLIAREMARGRLHADSAVTSSLDVDPDVRDFLACVTWRQLLEHTHGLDDSAISRCPTLPNGCIDIRRLCGQLDTRPLAAPGQFYSYAGVGAWLLASFLEQQLGQPIERILQEQLFDPLGVRAHRENPPAFARSAPYMCPAFGFGMALTMRAMMTFLRHHLLGSDAWCIGHPESQMRRSPIAPVPGLSPIERGVQLGWKVYGEGWFGHNSVLTGAPGVVRVNPQAGIAFLVTSAESAPMSVAVALFGKALPRFSDFRMPKLLSAEEQRQLCVSRFFGSFGNASGRIDVQPGESSSLELKAFRRTKGAIEPIPLITARLRAARDDAFFTTPSDPAFLPFVQFLGPAGEVATHLWNGTSVRRRELDSMCT